MRISQDFQMSYVVTIICFKINHLYLIEREFIDENLVLIIVY